MSKLKEALVIPDEYTKSGARHAYKMGHVHGQSGTHIDAVKSFGFFSPAYEAGYKAGSNLEAAEAWREKRGAAKEGRPYHESVNEEVLSEETISAINSLLAEGKMSQYLPPFKSNGLSVDDSRGNSVLEVTDHGTADEVAKALNAYFVKKSVKESKTEPEDLLTAHEKAKKISKEQGVVQHINKDKRSGKHYVSDWYNGGDEREETVASYNKGKLRESENLQKVADDFRTAGEGCEHCGVGDIVKITGNVNFKGKTGDIERFGSGKKFVVVKLHDGGTHSFHSSDVSPAEDVEEDDKEPETFFVAFYEESEQRSWIGKISKASGGKWHESTYKGKADHRWGQNYMSYLTPDDIMSWIYKDYPRGIEIEGPFFEAMEAEEYISQNWGKLEESADFKSFDNAAADKIISLKRQLREKQFKLRDVQTSIKNLTAERKGYAALDKMMKKFEEEIEDLHTQLKKKQNKKSVKEDIKPPRKGTVAYNAMMKRKEQEKDPERIKQIEKLGDNDNMYGIAKIKKVRESSGPNGMNLGKPQPEAVPAKDTRWGFRKSAPKKKEVEEGLADDILAAAKKVVPSAKIVTPEQKRKEREELDVKRAADRKAAPAKTPAKADPDAGFGQNRGYGQGRYMGDDVEISTYAKMFLEKLIAPKVQEAVSYTDFDDWKAAVLNSYPAQAKKIKFKGRMEGNKDTISAEVPGEDRSYGVWSQDEEKGVVLSEMTK